MRETEAERGEIWLERNRPDLAERELRKALTQDPENAENHALLALCLIELGRKDEAQDEAMRALALDAEMPLAHYARGAALATQGQFKPAEHAARRFLELVPDHALAYGLLAQSLAGQQRWRDALTAAEEGLELDPEDDGCANLRALALVQLGEADEADFALTAALERDPENALTHQNIAFKALRGGDADAAIRHYREALRLDPQSDSAREGLVEALKSRNIVYRTFLRLMLFLTKMPPRTVMTIFVGTIVARIVLRRVAEAVPALAPFLWPIFWALVVFIFMSWIAPPLFNLLLRLDSAGRHALSDAQRKQTSWLAGTLLVAAGFYAAYLLGAEGMGVAAVFAAVLVIPVCATFAPEPTTNRRLLGALTLGLAIAGGIGWFNGMAWEREKAELRTMLDLPTDGAKLTSETTAAAVLEWSGGDEEKVRSLMPRVDALNAREERFDFFLGVFMWGFVAFTWIASASGLRDRSS